MDKNTPGAAAANQDRKVGGGAAPCRSPGEAWNRFWFAPADPTVLSVLRILCGAVTFYTFLAYTFDLQALLGKHAWLDLQGRQILAREMPVPDGSLSWPQYYPEYRLFLPYEPAPPPKNEVEQDYLRRYIAKWGVPPPAPYPKTFAEAAFYEEYKARWGVDPRSIGGMGQSVWSIWFHVTDPGAMVAVQTVTLVISFLFLIGFCTRLTGALTWLAALSYIHRAPAALFGADTMMAVVLLYLIIGPSGAVLSVDRWLARWWARRKNRGSRIEDRGSKIAKTTSVDPQSSILDPRSSIRVAPSVSANLALRLMQVHLCFIYASAGLSKLLGMAWWSGTAVWGTMANAEFAPLDSTLYTEVLRFIARHRVVFEIVMNGASLFTLFFEISYAYLIWRPRTRWLMLAMAFAMHGFIGLFMGLKTFSIMMLTMNLAFVPAETMRWVLNKLTRGWYERSEAPAAPVEKGEPAESPTVGAQAIKA